MTNLIKMIIIIVIATVCSLLLLVVDTNSHEQIAFQKYINSLEIGDILDVESCKYKARYSRQIIFFIKTITKEKTIYYIHVDMTEDGYYFSKETHIIVDKNNLIINIERE